MAPKRNHSGSRRAPREVNHVEEWVQSVSDERALNNLVVLEIPDRATVGWRLAVGENFPTPILMNLLLLKITSSVDSTS